MKAYGRELSQPQDQLLTGEVVSERATVERLVRVVGALLLLHNRHRLDRHGRCSICWPIPVHGGDPRRTVYLHHTRDVEVFPLTAATPGISAMIQHANKIPGVL